MNERQPREYTTQTKRGSSVRDLEYVLIIAMGVFLGLSIFAICGGIVAFILSVVGISAAAR